MKLILLLTTLLSFNTLFAQNKADGFVIHEEARSARLSQTKYYTTIDSTHYDSITYKVNNITKTGSGYIIYKSYWEEYNDITLTRREYIKLYIDDKELSVLNLVSFYKNEDYIK